MTGYATAPINTGAMLNNMAAWYDPAGAVAQPAATPVMAAAAPMNYSPSSFDFGGGGGGSVFAPEGVNTSYASGFDGGGTAPTGAWQGVKGWLGNGQNLGAVMQGIGALTNAYLGFKQLSLAKSNLAFQKDSFNKNYANSVATYNTSLEDRIRGRQSSREASEGDIQAYLAKHKLGG